MNPVEILPVEGTLILQARGSELLILSHHVQALKKVSQPQEFVNYFNNMALINRPARKLFQAWLRKDKNLWKRLYEAVKAVEEEEIETSPAEEVPAEKAAKEEKKPAKKAAAKKTEKEEKKPAKKAAAKKTEKKATKKTATKKAAVKKTEKKAATKKTTKKAATKKKTTKKKA